MGVAFALLLSTACSEPQSPGQEEGSLEKKHRFILCNDGGSLAGPILEAPIGVEGLVQLAIEPLQDTLIDTLYWQLGTDPYMGSPSHRLSDYYSHKTQVGPIWGSAGTTFHSAGLWRIYENARQLIEAGTDPAAVVVEQGHRAGLEVFLCMRVNDVHDSRLEGGTEDPLISPTKRDHPDWLLGEEGSRKTAYNFALPQVREHKLALATEAIENYDLDGLDWDFCRHPYLFPQGQEKEGASLLTQLLSQIKQALEQKSERVGRKLLFSVRVPGPLGQALAQGMDVRNWLSQGLIDILIVGHQPGNQHRLPIEEFVEAARGTGTQVIAQGLGLFQQPRPLSARLIWNEKDYYSPEMCRAVAAAHFRAGAQGRLSFQQPLSTDRERPGLRSAALEGDRRSQPHRPEGQTLPSRPTDLGCGAASARTGGGRRQQPRLRRCRRRSGCCARRGSVEGGFPAATGGSPNAAGSVGDPFERRASGDRKANSDILQRDLARVRRGTPSFEAGVESGRRGCPGT